MGYRIEYGPAAAPRRRRFKPQLRLQILTAVVLILFTLGVKKGWPEGAGKLREFLLPSDTALASQEAMQTFLTSLESGHSLDDALTAFCREIVANADLPE